MGIVKPVYIMITFDSMSSQLQLYNIQTKQAS